MSARRPPQKFERPGEPLYGWSNLHGGGPAQVLYEKDPEPVLYDHLGRPLTKKRQRMGFVPPGHER